MNADIDALEARLAQTADPRERIDLLNALARELQFNDLERAIALAQQAQALSLQGEFADVPYQKGIADSTLNLGHLQMRQGKTLETLPLLFDALVTYRSMRDVTGEIQALGLIGIAYRQPGHYDKALDYLLQQLELARTIGDRQEMAHALNGIGLVYLGSQDYQQALDHFVKNYGVYLELGDRRQQAIALSNCAYTSLQLQAYDDALDYGAQSVSISREVGNKISESWALLTIAQTHLATGEYESALEYAQMNLEQLADSGYTVPTLNSLMTIGQVYAKQGQLAQALPSLEQALLLAQEIGDQDRQYECHYTLAQVYKDSGNWELALAHYEQFHAIKEKSFDERETQRRQRLMVLHETEQAQAEAELERQLREQAEAANQELEAFAYSVSHDLRAPLRAINGFSIILSSEHATELSPEARRYLGLIAENARQMDRLIDDLLAFSRLGRQALQKQRVLPADLVQEALNDLQKERAGRQVEFLVGKLPACQADPMLLKQVYANLLSNALKFTRTRDVARIEVGCEQTDDGFVYYVRDNGVGFDMRYADKLFGVFQRLHGEQEYEGTGVGLAIVQRIVHRHGGRVWAEAAVDQGATFSFTLE
jgi:signal transduction histidine kinase